MGFLINHKRSEIFKEFSNEEQIMFFNLVNQKYIHHVDTLYYSVFIKNDCTNNDSEKESNFKKNVPAGIFDMFDVLRTAKELLKDYDGESWLDYDKELLLKKTRYKIYDFCIGKNGYYDIFFCSSLPNNSTPRIVVQLRSIALWTVGEHDLLLESFSVVRDFLAKFDLQIDKCQENRIDFAYHTNCLQSPEKFYSDNILKFNCETRLSIFQKVGRKDGQVLNYDYLSFGQRSSNNIFFRSYNKVREVIEENYKEFFLKLWLDNGMINYYDFYVYSYAYKKHSYSQIYVGMMEFYLQYGKNKNVLSTLKALKETKYTIQQVKDLILKVCPMPTMVINIEFQTMRKFYYYSMQIDNWPIVHECYDSQLLRIYQILDCRGVVLEYLTDTTICFIKGYDDKGKKIYMDFWKRLRSCKVDKTLCVDYERVYSKKINRDIVISKIKSNLATLALYDGNWSTDLNDDMSQLICILNDNDVIQDSDGTFKVVDHDYNDLKEKKKKALKSIIKPSRPSNIS